MNILVAGGAGYIGSCCTEFLLDRGHEVVVLDSLVKGHRDAVDPRATFVRADVADRDTLTQALEDYRVEGIIHFAAFIEVGESMSDPGRYFGNNVTKSLQLMDAAVECGIRKLVFSSTAAVYGMPDRVPIPESEPRKPVNAYGESKLMVERMLKWYHEIHGLEYTALRYFNAAGATALHGEDHRPESHLIPIILQVALGQRENIQIYGSDYPTPDGTCVRDYIHVLDLASAHLLALESDRVGAYNLGSGSGYSVKEIVDVTREITGHAIPCAEAPRRPGDPPRLVSDSTAARQQLGWQPQYDDVRTIVQSAWQWKSQHPNGYGN